MFVSIASEKIVRKRKDNSFICADLPKIIGREMMYRISYVFRQFCIVELFSVEQAAGLYLWRQAVMLLTDRVVRATARFPSPPDSLAADFDLSSFIFPKIIIQ